LIQQKDTNGDGIPDALPTTADGKSISDQLSLPGIDKLSLSVYGAFQNTPTASIDQNQVENVTGNAVLAQAQSVEDGLKKYQQIDFKSWRFR
jgi:hypothetical protein